MSCTTLYMVPEQGGILVAAEFRNSHGGASFIWDHLVAKRLGWTGYWMGRSESEVQPLWDLWEDDALPEYERVALLSTFDRVMVRRENIPRIVAAFRAFVAAYPPENRVCSLLEQADELEKLYADPDCYAVCWDQTSVCEVWTRIYEEGDDEGRDYDVSIDTNHEFLFETYPIDAPEIDHALIDDVMSRCVCGDTKTLPILDLADSGVEVAGEAPCPLCQRQEADDAEES